MNIVQGRRMGKLLVVGGWTILLMGLGGTELLKVQFKHLILLPSCLMFCPSSHGGRSWPGCGQSKVFKLYSVAHNLVTFSDFHYTAREELGHDPPLYW